ncbi:hypothetical protein DDB_G0268384 [Dictyostelium discoideum AX4]|uniref:PH domain-containing protein n=1 Tax=Dictyostelium discoideum TaxID=44689 RepID=Q55FY1_DICDI|nr:hypothetical protein DDB_G0268384 [Dictyostelium discoideum AX4]EAL73645.1 hypothetical protein DDB_G0268384 [Dictyostelium discoideum AX4]|eukprot:XP_647402.1 hypothetical protein DDB_G0268384 [Dictyostelium discoideum AX4]
MDGVQGKLFVTVIQAQNLNITQDKKSAAEEIVGAIFDPFSSPILQSIEKIQNFSKSNVLPIFTPISGIIDTIATVGKDTTTTAVAEKGPEIPSENQTAESTGIVCTVTTEEQKFKTVTSPDVTEPKWSNQSHSFNIAHPCAELTFEVSLNNGEKESFLIGGAVINLLDEPHLWEQKPFAKWINLTKKHKNSKDNNNNNNDPNSNTAEDGGGENNSIIGNEYDQFSDEDEIVGRIEVQFQYKYRRIWDSIYCGKILLLEGKYQEALEQFKEAIKIYPTDPFIYSLMVDCCLGLKRLGSAIENNVNFIKYDKGFEGLIKMAQILMEANQLEKVQPLIDRAFKKSPNNERIKYVQLQYDHTVEVDKVNKAIEQGFEEFSKDDFASAAASFSRALEYNSNSVILYELRALSHLSARNQIMASADIDKILEIDHNWSKTDPIQSGHLLKDGQINVMSKKRWFTIKSYFLFWYLEQSDLSPQGMVCLIDFGCAPKPGQKVKFQLQTKDRTFNFKVVDDPKAYDKWIISLGKMAKVNKITLPLIDSVKSQIVWKNVFNKKEKTTFMLPDVMLLPEQIFVESGRFAFAIGDKIKSKLTSISLQDATMTGFLYKMGQLNKEWKKRFFFIQGTNLYYATLKESDFEKGTIDSVTPTGSMPLERCRIDQSPHSTNKTNSFEVISAFRRNILLATDKADDKDKWIKAIAIASGMQIVEEKESNEEKKSLPSSEALLNSRIRVKSLRAPPVVVVQQQKQKKLDDNDEFNNNNNNNDNDDNNNNDDDDDDDGGDNENGDNYNSNGDNSNGDNSNNHNNNDEGVTNRRSSDQLEQMTATRRPKKERQIKKISTNDVSTSENRYFSKFNLPSSSNAPAPTIITSKAKYSLNLSSDTNNNTASTSNNDSNEPESLANILGDDMPPPSKKYSINDENSTNYQDDDKDLESAGLISGKKKKVNEDGEDEDKKRCCKCTIQ